MNKVGKTLTKAKFCIILRFLKISFSMKLSLKKCKTHSVDSSLRELH